MTVDRQDPPLEAGERELLLAFLDYHRATLAKKCDGLAAEQLRERTVPPSSLSLLGLVRHMADVERNWFRRVLGGDDPPGLYWTEDNEDGDFDDVDTADVEADFATWQAEIEHARTVVSGFDSLDGRGFMPRRSEHVSLRWVLVHMIEEYARHNGHADLLRERIDGAVGV